jgi:formylglycine-generating enzyme required for sulfatase activity
MTPPSCIAGGPGMTNCGSTQESCCTSLEVTGGTYHRTFTNNGGGPTGEADPATLSDFRLDKYEVTVGRFRQFVEAVLPPAGAGWMPAIGSGKHVHVNGGNGLVNSAGTGGTTYEAGWIAAYNSGVSPTDANLLTSTYTPGPCVWTSSVGAHENLPMNCMTWQEAYAFCIWDGGFLPSEAEWGYAAAGGSEEREYPWGQTAPGVANLYAIYSCYYPSGSGSCGAAPTLANIAPVGTAKLGAGKWGQLDMSGEMADFNLDYIGPWGAAGVPAAPPYESPCTDCTYQYMSGTTRYVFRGGSFAGGANTTYGRNGDWPARSYGVGFRCARTP